MPLLNHLLCTILAPPPTPPAKKPLTSFHLLALFIQQVEKCGGFLADEVDAGAVVYVVDVVPGDAF